MYGIREDDSTPDAFPVGTSQTYIGLVSGLLTVVVLFFTCTVFLVKQRGRNKVALLQKHTALLCDSAAPGIAITPKDVKLPNSIANGLSLVRKPITIATSSNLAEQSERARANSRGTVYSDHRSSIYETTDNPFSEENFVSTEAIASARAVSSCTGEFRLCFSHILRITLLHDP